MHPAVEVGARRADALDGYLAQMVAEGPAQNTAQRDVRLFEASETFYTLGICFEAGLREPSRQ
jgi:hypothetical protein